MKSTTHSTDVSRDNVFSIVEELRRKYGDRAEKLHEANEAKTRLLLIDNILRALGWSTDDFNPEAPAGRLGFTDYSLSVDESPRLIVEAKRVSNTFHVPSSRMRRTEYPLSYLRRAFGPALAEVIEQATNYAHEIGVPFAVLTNGAEWMLIQVTPMPGPGHDINDLRGFYFGNLFSEGFNLDLFWELLSKVSVEEGSLEEQFAQLNLKEVDFSAVPRARLGGLQWKKSTNDHGLREFYRRFFDEIVDPGRRKMLEFCFVTNTRLDQYQGELKRALKDTAPSYVPGAVDISPEDGERLLSLESGDQKGRVIIVTGSVGCGKTTFVNKVLVEARQERDLVCLVIDLIDEVTDERNDVVRMVWKHITEEWKAAEPESYYNETLRKIFGKELSDLREGPHKEVFEHDKQELARREADLLDTLLKDPEQFFPRCWRFYTQKRKGIAVVLDNVDRASEGYQRQVYAFAHKLARTTGATIIITMREVTFFRGREGGFLDVRSSDKVFHLQTPNLEQLLSKRIRYVEERMEEDHRASRWRTSGDWDSFREMALANADMLKRTFLASESGRDALGLLAAVAWHDVRYFLVLLAQLHAMLGNSEKTWTFSDLVTALMTSADPANSPSILPNIYRPPYATYPCYFIKIRILLLLIYGRPDSEMRHGTFLTKILAFLRAYGYQERWARQAIQEMVRERLLECLEAPAEAEYTKNYRLMDTHSFRPSPLAVLLIKSIICERVYLSLVGNDLPFHAESSFKRYQKALESVLKVLDDSQLERAAVDLLSETDLDRIVARYLVGVLPDEQPAENLLKNIPDVSTTERELSRIAEFLSRIGECAAPAKKGDALPEQLLLIRPEAGQAESRLTDRVRIPKSITEIRVGNSTSAPLIFWAIVALTASGHPFSSGMEITRVINEYLVDDDNRREPTNISRALRSKVLQSQKWFRTQNRSRQRRKRFGLAKGWKRYWTELFDEPPPDLS